MLEPIKKPVKFFDVVDLSVLQEREAKYLVRQERKERAVQRRTDRSNKRGLRYED